MNSQETELVNLKIGLRKRKKKEEQVRDLWYYNKLYQCTTNEDCYHLNCTPITIKLP